MGTERVLADTIYRTRDNLRYCKEHGIHLNGPRLGKPPKDSAIRKRELHLEWLESGERGDIERRFGICKRCYSLGRITAKLKHPRNYDSYVCSHIEFAEEAQTSFALHFRLLRAFADRLICA